MKLHNVCYCAKYKTHVVKDLGFTRLKNKVLINSELVKKRIKIDLCPHNTVIGPYALLCSEPNSPPGMHGQHQTSKRKRSWSRAVFSHLQRKGLEKRFEVQKYVTKPDRRQLAAMLGLTDAQVRHFQS